MKRLLPGFSGIVLLIAAITVFVAINESAPRLSLFWVLGIIFGFILGRSRFCFVSGFANFFIFRDGNMLKTIIAGMLIASIGFAFIMHGWVADPSAGTIPPGAHVAPFGWHLLLAGFVFGIGMLLAGCCITGSLYRASGGFFYAVIALFGVILGMGGFLHTRELWWSGLAELPRIWLPSYLGWAGSLILVVSILVTAYLVVHYLQEKARRSFGIVDEVSTGQTLQISPARAVKALFISHWPTIAGGVLLGLLNIAMYALVDRPLGVTGEIQRWAELLFNAAGLTTPPVVAVPGT
ncbi:MAG: YeeE/YedE family protein [Dehalococcoidaceae bacterium]|nr:YeeE/YedE family protein [Dehalococcoidaceae bacterium]